MDKETPKPHPSRPPRLRWVFASDPVYLVTCCTRNRQRILATDLVHDAFVATAHRIQVVGAAVGRYVIMPDHVHAFVRIGRNARLGRTVAALKAPVTKAVRVTQPEADVWQDGFFDHLLRSSESYAEKWQYVRNNPVRAGLVKTPEAWPFQGEIVPLML